MRFRISNVWVIGLVISLTLVLFQNCDGAVPSGEANASLTSRSSGDPYAANVVLHMHFDGSDGSAVFPDQSARAHGNAAVEGTARISSQGKFNGSLALDGSGYLTFPNSPDWNLSQTDLTIEFWVNPKDGNPRGMLSQSPVGNDHQWHILRYNQGPHAQFNGGGADISAANTLPINTWSHVAITKQSGLTRLFVNGMMVASGAVNPFNQSANPLYIGGTNSQSNGNQYFFFGNIDELRITKGVARYITNFTPADQPF